MAGPDTDKKDSGVGVADGKAAQSAGQTPKQNGSTGGGKTPAPRKRGVLGPLLAVVLLLVIVLGLAGYGAIMFRDKDERIALAADYVEKGLAEAQADLERAQASLAELTGAKPPSKEPATQAADVSTYRSSPPTAEKEATPEKAPADAAADTAKKTAEAEKPAGLAPIEPPKAPEPAPAPTAAAPSLPAPLPPPANTATTAAPTAPAAKIGEAVDDAARKALLIAEEAKAGLETLRRKVEDRLPAGGELTDREMMTALEGRIDQLGDQLKTLRDAPKNETRADLDANATAKAAGTGDGAGTMVVVAFTLQRELEPGRAFAAELGALNRLGAEQSALAPLGPYAEKGAPTGAQLHDAFLPVAKKILALESHPGADLTEHLMHSASKLVRLHPTGQAPPETLEGKIHRIDAALTHNDFAAAEAAFASLPDAAREDAKEFGETLRNRNDAAKAADALLHGAIAALGGVKK